MLELMFVKGPISQQQIQIIADLYGKYNLNYKSISFCEHLFNKNPYGYSYHGFLIDSEAGVVGHYGMIPIELMAFAQVEESVKGEAFVVEEGHRNKTVMFNGQQTLPGLALSIGLTHFVISQGVSLLHLMAPRNVALIHRRAGCKEMKLAEVSSYFFNETKGEFSLKNVLKQCAKIFQNCFYRLFSSVNVIIKAECLPFSSLTEVAYQQIIEKLEELDSNEVQKWSINLKGKTLKWYLESLVTHVVMIPGNFNQFALIRKGLVLEQSIEIFTWISPDKVSLNSIAIMAKIIQGSKECQSPWIRFSNNFILGNYRSIKNISRLFSYFSKAHEISFYTKSNNPVFREKEYVNFNPFFYIIF